jgi:DNA-binding GntR family transcriptional regulator
MAMTSAFDPRGEDKALLSDRIRNALTDQIASGELAPGAALDEQQLADRFGVSRTPIREALRQLAVTGLVEIRPRRGVVVARMTSERIMEMFETMAEVEAVCARLATYRMTPIERSRLLDLHEAARRFAAEGDVDGYDRINHAFHQCIYQATHNAFLAELATSLRSRMNALRRVQLRHKDRPRRSALEHQSILEALAEGDGEVAARRMRAHMLNAASALREYIESTQVASSSSPNASD